LAGEHRDYIDEINKTNELSDELAAELVTAMNNYKKIQTPKGPI
jgi:hypothetical protein